MQSRLALLALALGLTACTIDAPLGPHRLAPGDVSRASNKGSGLTLNVVPNVTLPILGSTNSIVVNQEVLTNFSLVENVVGQIVGLDVTGTLSGTEIDVLGNTIGIITQPFTSEVSVTSSGPGQCSVLSLDLSSINLNALGVLNVSIPANVDVKGSGAVGSLLCNLGQLLSGITSGLSGGQGAQGVVNALNNQIQ
jgi:hypothetical protein